MRLRLLPAAALLVALALPAAASAVVPAKPPLPPKPPTDAALAAAAAEVRWPIARPTVYAGPGTTYTVRVRRGSAPVTVSLVRLASSGRVMRTVASRRLRRGAFTVTLPPTAPAAYALRLRAGGRTFFNVVMVPAPFSPPVVPVQPAPQPAPPASQPPCASDDPTQASAALAVVAGSATPSIGPVARRSFASGPPAPPVAPGTRVDLRVTNSGPTCLAEWPPALQRETAPGVWKAVMQRDAQGNLIVYPAVLNLQLSGTTRAISAFIPPDASPGTYRIVVPVVFLGVRGQVQHVADVSTDPFTVAAP